MEKWTEQAHKIYFQFIILFILKLILILLFKTLKFNIILRIIDDFIFVKKWIKNKLIYYNFVFVLICLRNTSCIILLLYLN